MKYYPVTIRAYVYEADHHAAAARAETLRTRLARYGLSGITVAVLVDAIPPDKREEKNDE